MLYYPRQVINVDGLELSYNCGMGFDSFEPCNSTYESEMLNSTTDLNRSFGGPEGSCQSLDPNVDVNNSSQNGLNNDTAAVDVNNSSQNGTNNDISAAGPLLAFFTSHGWYLVVVGTIATLI